MPTVTDVGIEAQARMVAGVSPPAAFQYIALGTNATLTAEGPTNTALDTEMGTLGGERAAATCEFIAPGTTRWSHTFYFTGVRALNELAIFNTPGNGTGDMFMRHVLLSTLNYNADDSIEIIVSNTTQRT